jgi:myosin heavy subunit
MSDDNANKQSTDNTIIDFLAKKGTVVDQTEKLALARISSKMQISPEQLDMSINRLCGRNLIRKIYLQGKVGFELTPKGKASLEAIAKAETDRITKQLQEAIVLEQKAKLRLNAVKKIKSIEKLWQNYKVPDESLIDKTEQEATQILEATKEIKEKQPLCNLIFQKYDQEFVQFKTQVEKMFGQNSNLTQLVNNYAKIKNDLAAISADIKNAQNTIKKYETVTEAADQINQMRTSLNTLKSIQTQLSIFNTEQLERFIELSMQLRENSRLLDSLKKPTHEFKPIKVANIAEKTAEYFDTEGPINDGYKTSGYPLMEKCSKCGVKRKSMRVDIG